MGRLITNLAQRRIGGILEGLNLIHYRIQPLDQCIEVTKMIPTCLEKKEYHLLLLNYYETKVITLDSRLITLGRDPEKDISIECDKVSREHATFLRVPSPEVSQYEYRIIDGGSSKNRSKNGIMINGKSSYLHRLDHGDLIYFSKAVKGLYLKVGLDPGELRTYINIIQRVRDLDERTCRKIMLMTRIFDKIQSHLSGEEATVTLNPIL